MPPGVSIPVHHDTGHWVKHCHRIHVAIDTGEEVDFMVGPTDDLLKKTLYDEGRIVELNNQAKHAVSNNMTRNRIHLIFDYVDDHPLTRHVLQPGEVVYQTRRSIDLARGVDKASYEIRPPTFVIIGAQKCGTTSLYEFISQHPLVLKGKRRETHYFDWRFNHDIEFSVENAKKQYDYYMNYYQLSVLNKHKSLITGESTPSYLLHSDIVIPRMKAICPWTKVIVMLRNPTDRAFSQFQMVIDQEGSPEQLAVRGQSSYTGMSFEQIVDTEIAELVSLGVTADCSYEHFQKAFLSTRTLLHGGHSIIGRGLYALQIGEWKRQWPADQLKILSISDIKGTKSEVQVSLDNVFSYIGIPPVDVTDLEAKNTRSYEKLTAATRAKLDAFYKPFNDKLFEMLGKELVW
eukprot:gene31548-38965_t